MAGVKNDAFYGRAERRIEYLTLGLGAAASLAAAWRWSWLHAAGMALGAALAWVNYRWLKHGLNALARAAAAQTDAEKVRVPKSMYLKFFARYVLILGVVCAMFAYSLVPALAVLGGLFALVAAVLVEMLYELVRGVEEPQAP